MSGAAAATRADISACWQANPLIAHVVSVGLSGRGPVPELFESGMLPPYLASGLDPQTLLLVPAAARHPVARAESAEEARRIVARYCQSDAAERAARDFADDEGNVRYVDRVLNWVGVLPGEISLDATAWMAGIQ